MFKGPAIALLELESIARGYVVADAMVKRAPVRLLMTEAVSPGKFLVLCDGEVGDVDEAFREGMELAGSAVLDSLYLPQAHPGLSHALQGKAPRPALDSLGIVETQTVCSALLSADAAYVTGHTLKADGGMSLREHPRMLPDKEKE